MTAVRTPIRTLIALVAAVALMLAVALLSLAASSSVDRAGTSWHIKSTQAGTSWHVKGGATLAGTSWHVRAAG
jgi:hypothetical protein